MIPAGGFGLPKSPWNLVGAIGVAHRVLDILVTQIVLNCSGVVRVVREFEAARVAQQAAFDRGKIDAYLGFPPDTQELRAKRIGHVVVNSALDGPWSPGYSTRS